jgi:hypothetical protein
MIQDVSKSSKHQLASTISCSISLAKKVGKNYHKLPKCAFTIAAPLEAGYSHFGHYIAFVKGATHRH